MTPDYYEYGDGDVHLCNLCQEYTGTEEYDDSLGTYLCKLCKDWCN